LVANFTNVTIEQGQSIEYVIPEFTSFLILPPLMIATILVVIVYKRKHVGVVNRG